MSSKMSEWIDLIAETKSHFEEGAKSVRAYTEDTTYIITRESDTQYVITTEEPGFPKKKTGSLEEYFKNVFGIEARY
jgi:hypothetical protein